MKDLALDTSTHDLLIEDGDLQPISGLEAIAQELDIRLQTWLREWFLDLTAGIDFEGRVFGKGKPTVLRDAEFKREILAAEHVLKILEYTAVLDRGTRALTVFFRALVEEEEEVLISIGEAGAPLSQRGAPYVKVCSYATVAEYQAALDAAGGA